MLQAAVRCRGVNDSFRKSGHQFDCNLNRSKSGDFGKNAGVT
jgi:hypothetical protein